MTTLSPWGPAEWLLPKFEPLDWHLITSASFEDRCTATAEWLLATGIPVKSASLFRISNPPSELWDTAEPKITANYAQLLAHLGGTALSVFEVQLLQQPLSAMAKVALLPHNSASVILDISTFPKRFFFMALLRLMNSQSVENLIVAYSKPKRYPETALWEDALPPSAMQGFARTEPQRQVSRMLVGVGYVALNVEDLVDSATHLKLDFLFPFPPASPAFRRNWELISRLVPEQVPRTTEIHRVDGMDAFEVCRRIQGWGRECDIQMLPLGPKPHALGMAMAYLRLGGSAEIKYAQPKAYKPNYSEGISTRNGVPDIVTYCLKRRGTPTF